MKGWGGVLAFLWELINEGGGGVVQSRCASSCF
jgi:hypothetical protein